ncbi:MAG: DUF6174 domain-containing protein [Chloroflexota bacterium]
MISIKSRRARRIGIFVFLLFLVFFVLIGFKINLPWRIADAKAQWAAQNIRDYRYRVQFASMAYIGSVYITVSDGQTVRIEEDTTNPLSRASGETPKLKDISASPNWYQYWPSVFPADLSKYSADELFDFAAKHPQPLVTFCTTPSTYDISYNPEHGYVDGVSFGDCPSWDIGLCLFAPAIGDCESGFGISEFEVLPAKS